MKPSVSEKIKKRLYPGVLFLFANNDFHNVTLRDISNKTGISTGTIYKHFNSKEDLLFSIIDEELCKLAGLMRLHISGLESTREIFRKLFWVTMDFFDNNADLTVAAFITVPLKTFMKNPAYRRDEEINIIYEVVEKAKKSGRVNPQLDKRYFSNLYFMVTHRHIHNWYFYDMKWNLADTIDDFFNFFWNNIKTEHITE